MFCGGSRSNINLGIKRQSMLASAVAIDRNRERVRAGAIGGNLDVGEIEVGEIEGLHARSF